jgi:hypothetical protein
LEEFKEFRIGARSQNPGVRRSWVERVIVCRSVSDYGNIDYKLLATDTWRM